MQTCTIGLTDSGDVAALKGTVAGALRSRLMGARNDMSMDERLERAARLVDLLDRGFVVPGTSFRFGLDPLIGLVPGVGDLISALSSLYVIELLSPGLPAFTRYRMFWNVFVDLLIGSVPVVGDLFDFAFKANTRNLQLARRALGRDTGAEPALAHGT